MKLKQLIYDSSMEYEQDLLNNISVSNNLINNKYQSTLTYNNFNSNGQYFLGFEYSVSTSDLGMILNNEVIKAAQNFKSATYWACLRNIKTQEVYIVSPRSGNFITYRGYLQCHYNSYSSGYVLWKYQDKNFVQIKSFSHTPTSRYDDQGWDTISDENNKTFSITENEILFQSTEGVAKYDEYTQLNDVPIITEYIPTTEDVNLRQTVSLYSKNNNTQNLDLIATLYLEPFSKSGSIVSNKQVFTFIYKAEVGFTSPYQTENIIIDNTSNNLRVTNFRESKNILSEPIIEDFGIQAHSGFRFFLNDEPIMIGKTGIWEFHSQGVTVEKLSLLVSSEEDKSFLINYKTKD